MYNIYPAVDSGNNFPPPIVQALADSQQLTDATTERIATVENPVRIKLDELYMSSGAIIDGGLP